MLRESATRVLIADAVGLGKTIQAGLILRQLATERESFRALVVVPASLRDQWGDELQTRFDLQANIVVAPWLARAARELPDGVSPWALPGVYICSFEFMRRPEVLRPLEDLGWDLLVVDEAHAATAGTARRAAVHAVALRSRRVLLLTATPHAGDDDDFRALCAIGSSELRPDPIVLFQRCRADVGIPGERRTTFVAVTLSNAERDVHRLLERYTSHLCAASRVSGDRHTRLLAIVLRKRALSCLSVLVRSCRRRLVVLETGRQADIGEQLSLPLDGDERLPEDADWEAILAAAGLADVARERHWLEAIVAAGDRVAGAESKIARLKKLLRRIKEPAIVFTEYRDTLVGLAEVLRTSHPDLSVLHGGMAADERCLAQKQFNEKGNLLLATDAASEGLNLQYRCRTVIHFELPWSPARLEQRAGRVDRIGQRGGVREMILVASDTAERLVLAPLARRALRAQALAPAATHLAASLSESRVAGAIMDGIPLEPTRHAFEEDT
jgi:SNF2 family DNA or RNA helicase